MNKTLKQILFRTPRVAGILFILFLSLFALDIFDMQLGFWETIVGLFMHLIPSILLTVVIIIAWRWEWVGAMLFIGLALLAVCETVQLIKTNVWALGILVVALIFFSYQITILARTLSDWFYRSIFETIIAYRLDLEDIVRSVKSSATRKRQGGK